MTSPYGHLDTRALAADSAGALILADYLEELGYLGADAARDLSGESGYSDGIMDSTLWGNKSWGDGFPYGFGNANGGGYGATHRDGNGSSGLSYNLPCEGIGCGNNGTVNGDGWSSDLNPQ